MIFSSCEEKDTIVPCNEPNNIIETVQQISFRYGDTDIPIDINNDGIYDFKFQSEKAGNRINKLLVPIGGENKILDNPMLREISIGSGYEINSESVFKDRLNFNNLGGGIAGNTNGRFIGLKIVVDKNEHFGWIEFSSNTGVSSESKTPIYYLNLDLTIHQSGFNEGCGSVTTP